MSRTDSIQIAADAADLVWGQVLAVLRGLTEQARLDADYADTNRGRDEWTATFKTELRAAWRDGEYVGLTMAYTQVVYLYNAYLKGATR